MAAPVETDVILAVDTSNIGKRVRTQSRDFGGTVRHMHYFIPVSARAKKVFHYSTPLQSVLAAAHDGTTTAFFWLQNPTASIVDLVIRKAVLRFGTTNVLTSTVPRILLVKFTFASTASGATVTPARRKAADANAADMRTAPTGMTSLTLGATIATFITPQMHAAGQFFGPPAQEWPSGGNDPYEDDDIILIPGEGAVLYQADAGTASDPRRFTVDLRAEEVER